MKKKIKKSGAGGRPSKYQSDYAQMLIEHMARGYSYESFAAVINVNRDTLYYWEDSFPEFSDAKKKAFDKCLLRWEQIGIAGTIGVKSGAEAKLGNFNAGSWIFNMKNRFNWRDKHEHTGKDGERLSVAALVARVESDADNEQ